MTDAEDYASETAELVVAFIDDHPELLPHADVLAGFAAMMVHQVTQVVDEQVKNVLVMWMTGAMWWGRGRKGRCRSGGGRLGSWPARRGMRGMPRYSSTCSGWTPQRQGRRRRHERAEALRRGQRRAPR